MQKIRITQNPLNQIEAATWKNRNPYSFSQNKRKHTPTLLRRQLERIPAQRLEDAVWIILLRDRLQPRQALALAIEPERFLPWACVVQEDKRIIQPRRLRLGLDGADEVGGPVVDVGVIGRVVPCDVDNLH